MIIRIGELRRYLRRAIRESGGGSAHYPYVRNAMGPTLADREALDRISVKDTDGKEEIAPHLREPDIDPCDGDDCFGPVPPKKDITFYAASDPYAADWNVRSTSHRY